MMEQEDPSRISTAFQKKRLIIYRIYSQSLFSGHITTKAWYPKETIVCDWSKDAFIPSSISASFPLDGRGLDTEEPSNAFWVEIMLAVFVPCLG